MACESCNVSHGHRVMYSGGSQDNMLLSVTSRITHNSIIEHIYMYMVQTSNNYLRVY